MPQKTSKKIVWFLILFSFGLAVAFSRVGVGAHYPFDVIIGSIIGYILAVISIKIYDKIKLFRWIHTKKYYPVFLLLLLVNIWTIIIKIRSSNLLIFYFALFALIVSIYIMVKFYVKKG